MDLPTVGMQTAARSVTKQERRQKKTKNIVLSVGVSARYQQA